MNVGAILYQTARAHGTKVALRYGERSLTYTELDERASAFGSALLSRGLEPGDRVAIFMPNCPEYVVALFGAFKLGLAVVPVNAKLVASELEVILQDSGARALVTSDATPAIGADFDWPGIDVIARVGGVDGSFEALLAEGDPAASMAAVDPTALAWLFYTSGTTGRPKGAQLSHRNLLAMTLAQLANVCAFQPDDRVLHVAPLSHGSGLYLLGSIARATENLIYKAPRYEPEEVLELVEREAVSVIAFMAPTMITMLLDARPEAETRSLRRVVYGGGPINVQHARRMLERFGRVFVQIYGQGESPMTITYLDPEAHDPDDLEVLASAGVPQTGVEVTILDSDDHPLPVGSEGEVCVRGDVVMGGYWRNPDATAVALRGGWLHTGDIGRFDERGRLFLLDRMSDTIISGGTNIYPREVEDVLMRHAGVKSVVVFGIPNEVWGQSVAAVVIPVGSDPPSEEELINHCRRHAAAFKKPKAIYFVDDFPENAYGKVLRRELRARFAGPSVSSP